ncbi:hypothetical protein [Parapedobacter tibetensis]|uniref:hypothetical protein n=1 Tax=Parapedobacter tibetensis TaxID=2972951 RepID=UPI00214D2515|nr:hypothetical protein [Parapedobacter tibetensis]
MKNLMITTCLILSIFFCFGQKTLSEVNLKNEQLEEISSSSIPDIQAYQREKFKNPRGGFFTAVELGLGEHSKIYKLKGSDDLIQITPRLNKELVANWDKAVLGYVETLTPVSHNNFERYTEHINNQNSKAIIFFIKDYKLTNSNFILYKNTDKKIALLITYISNSPDDVKIDNMRKIVNDLKIE